MLSNGFARPLHLKRKTSRLLAAFLVNMHVLALLALLQPLALNSILQVLLFGVLLFSGIYHAVLFRRQSDGQHFWTWQAGGAWRYGEVDQAYALVSSSTVQTPWFVTLTLSNRQQQRRLLVVRDQLDADTFRRLRVRVKLAHEDAAANSEEAV